MQDTIQIVGAFLASGLGAAAFLKFFAEKTIETGLQKALHRETLLTEAELEFRKRQLEEFYGPIYASLKLLARIYPLWLEGRFKEVNSDIIALFMERLSLLTRFTLSTLHRSWAAFMRRMKP